MKRSTSLLDMGSPLNQMIEMDGGAPEIAASQVWWCLGLGLVLVCGWAGS